MGADRRHNATLIRLLSNENRSRPWGMDRAALTAPREKLFYYRTVRQGGPQDRRVAR